ncbi:MAG TPA: tetratricopeptide repeat protein [Actinomycetota bacterium]|nr:tetratricopeptide repeat protein [Actinomycetota bacterium]
MAGGPELDLGDIDRLDSRSRRHLAACIVLVSLLSSVVALLAADAGARADERTREAERSAVTAMAADARAYVEYFGGLASYAEAQPAELRRSVAEARALAGTDGAAADAARWRSAGDALADLSPPASEPDPDAAAQRSFQDLYERVDLASLLQGTRRETADAWSDRAERYSAVLTLLAIVLSVLGLAATFGQRLRRPLVRSAVVVALACLVVTAAVAVRAVPEVPDGAVGQVADGDRLLTLGDHQGAIDAYSRAVGEAPGYAVAYVRRAGAYALQGSPERDQAYVFSITTPEARARSITDLERAFRLGAGNDVLALATQGANYFFVRRYGDAEALARRALDRNPRLTVARLSLGLALAAQGRAGQAARSFDRFAGQAAEAAAQRERQELFAAGHTTLEQLARQEPGRAGLARQLQDQLTAAQTVAAGYPLRPSAPGAAASDLALSTGDRSLTATYRHRGLRRGDVLTWIAYTRPDPGSPWRQRPTLTGFERFAGPMDADTGRVVLATGQCPASGDYRVDLYLGGVLQASAEVTPPPPPEPLVAADDLLASLRVCRPETWAVTARRPGLLEARSPGDAQRLTVRVFPAPPDLTRAGAASALAGLADRLAARRGFRPTGARPVDRPVDSLRGTLRAYQRPGERDRALTTWVSLGPDDVLRTVVLEGTRSDRALFGRLLDRVGFPNLDG